MVDPMKKPPQPRRSRLELWISLALLAAIIAVYAQVRSFAFINYDDPDYVTANTHVLSGLNPQSLAWAFTSTQDANWFPLTRLSHLADVQLFGLDAGAHHLTNVAIHGLSALLLFVLLKRITRASWPSAFAAFVFAVHPLHVESVAWVSERKDVLSGLFWMLTLWAYLRYSDRTTFARYSLVVLLFCCGLMAKPMIVTLPFVMLLIDYWRERPGWKRLILEKIPLFAIAIAAGIATFVIQQRGGSVSTIAQVPLQLRLGNAAASYIIYLAQFLWPAKLAVFYPFVAQSVWMEVSAVLTLLVVTFTVLRRGVPRYLTIGWLWYVGTLFPVIGLIQVGAQSRADRYTYIPLIGISIAIAFGAAELIERRPSLRPAIAACAVAACIAWTAVAMSYASDWQSSIALFEHAAHATRANYIAYNNLGDALRDAGRPTEAIRNFEMAVEIKPAFAEAQDNLGEALLSQGRLDEALPHILEAVRLDPKAPEARVNLGTAMRQRGMLKGSEVQYREAIALDPENAAARRGLGNVLAQQNRFDEALAQYREALRVQPGDPDSHYNLGLLAAQMGNQGEAIAQFIEVVRLQPSSPDARFNLGNALAQANRFEDAAAAFQAAVRLKPDYVRAHFNLASSLATLGRYADAAREFEAVLQLQPDFAEARKNLELCRQLQAEHHAR